jgi:hypothetical protein
MGDEQAASIAKVRMHESPYTPRMGVA